MDPSRKMAARWRAGHILTVFLLAGFVAMRVTQAAGLATTNAPTAIPWNQIGAQAGANYQGEGLAVTPTESGARLHCVFQRLDGKATPEGLWLTSTVTNTVGERFRVRAVAVGRTASMERGAWSVGAWERQTVESSLHAPRLPDTGTVTIDGQTVRLSRPGLTEEYSVSMDGVQQDFVVIDRPLTPSLSPADGVRVACRPGEGELRVELSVTGARVEPTTYGAQLVLEQSGRKLAYSRLHATDANGKELPARIEAVSVGDEVTSLKSKPGDSTGSAGTSQRLVTPSPTLVVVVDDSNAVYPVRIDPTFSDANWVSLGGVPGANGYVYATVTDGSGNLYIGGRFTAAGNILAANIAQWNGTNWSALGSGISGGDQYGTYVYALAMSGGTLYAGGDFTTAGGSAATNIAKWNGSSWSPLGSGMRGGSYPWVSALVVSGSTLYAGGGFTNAGGSTANYIAQWNGSSWSPLGSGMSGSVGALAVSGSTLYAGGAFTNAGGNAANYIAQWNGSSWSALGSGLSGSVFYPPSVYALAVSGGRLYAGGYFTNAGGIAANNIAQWNGSSWSALGSGIGPAYSAVYALAVSGTNLYAGGGFTTAGGIAANNIAQWNGSSWSTLGSGMGGNPVLALAVSGGGLYAGGYFVTAGGTGVKSIAQWNGSTWSVLGSGIAGSVYAVAVSGNTLYAGGQFTQAGSGANNIAQWNGSSWSALGSGISGGDQSGPFVRALVVSGGMLYAGGDFTTAGGNAANNIAEWNGSSWSPLGSGLLGSPYASPVFALAVSGGTLYAGGSLTNAGGSAADYIAQWNGSSWSPLGSGVDDYVFALAVSGTTLYAGGIFTTAGAVSANYIAQWDGSSWSALGSGMDRDVYALAVSGGTLYAGGYFENAGGIAATNIAQWNGSSWSALGSGMSFIVYALAVSGGTLYAGGEFTTAGGIAVNNIAQWNGSSWSALGSGLSGGAVQALAASGGTLYAGGLFTTAGGKVSAYVAEAYLIAPPGGLVDSIVVPSPGTADVNCFGNPGQQFGVQRTTNVSPPLWTNVNSSPLIPAADGSFTFVDTNAPPGAAYYRAFQY